MAQLDATNKPMTALEWGLVIALAAVWGGSFFFNDIAVRELPTFTVVVCRVALGACVLIGVMVLTGQAMPRSAPVWRAFLTMGFLNNVVPFSLIVWGQIHIASGLASILNATTPLFVVMVAHWATTDEKLTRARFFGVLAGLAGVAVMIGGDALSSIGTSIVAQLAILGAACAYAFAGVYGRRFKQMGVSPMATATGQVVGSSIIMVPLVVVVDQPWTLPAPSWSAVSALIAIATLSTALAYILYFRILATAGATNLLLVTFLVPVTAILLGVSLLGERLELQHLIGMVTIGIGLAAIDGRPYKLLRRAAPSAA